MLTRLKISVFKNLLDVEVHLGAFTCIAEANDVGKFNLVDAIQLISGLSHLSLIKAASATTRFYLVGNRYSRD
jgi:AAA15 family ATPase/GTPase